MKRQYIDLMVLGTDIMFEEVRRKLMEEQAPSGVNQSSVRVGIAVNCLFWSVPLYTVAIGTFSLGKKWYRRVLARFPYMLPIPVWENVYWDPKTPRLLYKENPTH